MDTAGLAIIYEQRISLTKRQVRCCIAGRWSDWRDLTVADARALDAEQAVGDGACLDAEAMYRVARNCWPLAHQIEGCTA